MFGTLLTSKSPKEPPQTSLDPSQELLKTLRCPTLGTTALKICTFRPFDLLKDIHDLLKTFNMSSEPPHEQGVPSMSLLISETFFRTT